MGAHAVLDYGNAVKLSSIMVKKGAGPLSSLNAGDDNVKLVNP